MTKNRQGFNLMFFLILAVIFFMMFYEGMKRTDNSYTRGALLTDLEEGKVVTATVQPNQEAPTGSVKLLLQGGEYKTIYVPDVNELQEV